LSVADVSFELQDAFKSIDDPTQMDHDLVLNGADIGLAAFYSRIVAFVLDEMDNSDYIYEELLDVLRKCCANLARKIQNIFKVPSPFIDAPLILIVQSLGGLIVEGVVV
jgi:hypothetical protein